MNKTIFGLIALGMLSCSIYAKQVTTCVSYLVGANSEMDCSGDYKGKATMVELYKKGWTYRGDISGTNKFVLVFEK
jgi:hypothetical protein